MIPWRNSPSRSQKVRAKTLDQQLQEWRKRYLKVCVIPHIIPKRHFTKTANLKITTVRTFKYKITNINFLGDDPLPKFTDKNKKKARVRDEDDFINDGPIIVGESVRRKQSPDDKKFNKEQTRFQEVEKKKKKRSQEAASFEDLLKLASKVSSINNYIP